MRVQLPVPLQIFPSTQEEDKAKSDVYYAEKTAARRLRRQGMLKWVGVLKSVTFTELCSFDSESSEKKILLIEYVFILRSSNPFDGWLCLPPPQHGP